jgi:hypothetical protein
MIRDTWYMIHGIWYDIYDGMWCDVTWYIIYDIRYTIHDIRYAIHDTWYMVYDIWYIICDIWYVIPDTWYMTRDMIWYDMIWYDMIWYDMIWYMIWYDIFNCNWVATRWQEFSTELQRTDIGKYSFVNMTITDWNKLPDGATGISQGKTHILKTRVRKV